MTDPVPPGRSVPSARPSRAGRGRRRKAAPDSRIAASGLAFCATFGMVLGMALGQAPTEIAANAAPPVTVAPVAVPRPPRPEIVIIQRRYVPVAGTGGSSGSSSSGSYSSSSSSSSSSSGTAPAPAPAPAPPPTSSGGS